MTKEEDDKNEFLEDLRFAFDVLAETLLLWRSQGEPDETYWAWVLTNVEENAADILAEEMEAAQESEKQ